MDVPLARLSATFLPPAVKFVGMLAFSVIAARAMRMFPHLAEVNIVRSWRAIRVMPEDGFPIYDQSARHPGAFLATCHSGVTLAAAHALTLAPMIANGALDDPRVAAFSAARFAGRTHVQAAE